MPKKRQKLNRRDHLKYMTAFAALGVSGCSGGSSGSSPSSPIITPPPPLPPPPPPSSSALKDVFGGDFKIGAAVQAGQISGGGIDQDLCETHFNSFTAEFEMKADINAPEEDQFDFAAGDTIVDFAETNGAVVRGHALLWYRSTPDYFLTGDATTIRTKLETYIDAVLTHYAGRIEAWDVVNEVITDATNTNPYRTGTWYDAVGKDYIDWAFQAARAADPTTKLFINDYNTELTGKRGRFIDVIRDLLDRGIPLDGVGHQAHLQIDGNPNDLLSAIDEIDALGAGLEQHVTELDVSVYSDPGLCFDSGVNCATGYGSQLSDVPDSVLEMQAQLYRDLFEGFKTRDSLTSVSVWGVRDSNSWLNDFPISRSNYPLLFDSDGNEKSAFSAITDPAFVS